MQRGPALCGLRYGIARSHARRRWQQLEKIAAQQLAARPAKELAIGGVRECQRGIGQEAADEGDLAFDHVAIQRLAALEGGFVLATIGDVEGRTDITGEFPIGADTRHAVHLNPTILAVVTARAILHLHGQARVEMAQVEVIGPLHIVAMHGRRPALPQVLFEGRAGEVQPAPVGEFAARLRIRSPHHHRRLVRDDAKTFFTLAQRIVDAAPLLDEHCRQVEWRGA